MCNVALHDGDVGPVDMSLQNPEDFPSPGASGCKHPHHPAHKATVFWFMAH